MCSDTLKASAVWSRLVQLVLPIELDEFGAFQREVVHQAFLTEYESDDRIVDCGGIDRAFSAGRHQRNRPRSRHRTEGSHSSINKRADCNGEVYGRNEQAATGKNSSRNAHLTRTAPAVVTPLPVITLSCLTVSASSEPWYKDALLTIPESSTVILSDRLC
jgi:hypothetical protein